MSDSPRVVPGLRTARRRRRRTAVVLAASYAGALCLAAGGYLAYRVHVHHATFASRTFFWLGDVHAADAAAGFRMAPNRTGVAVLDHGIESPERRIPVRTDARGFRIPLDAAADAAIVPGGLAAIGCSCTFGHGVAAESTYVARAGALLELPAYNLGVCAYSSVTSLALLREHMATLRPACVVYGFGNFHLERSRRPRTDGVLFQPYARDAAGGDVAIVPPPADNRLVFALAPRIEAAYYRPKLEGRAMRLDAAHVGAVLPLAVQDLRRALSPNLMQLRFEPEALDASRFYPFLLDELAATCRAHDARLVVLFFPAAFGEAPDPQMVAAVRARAADDRFALVDCGPRLFAGVRDQAEYAARWQMPRDGHPNRFMHEAMGRAVAEQLLTWGVGRPAPP